MRSYHLTHKLALDTSCFMQASKLRSLFFASLALTTTFISLASFAQVQQKQPKPKTVPVVVYQQPLMQIEAQEYPGKVYFMGLTFDETQSITGLYYDDETQKRNYATLKDAQEGLTLIKITAKNPITRNMRTYEVVKLKVNYAAETKSADVTFSYLNNGINGNYIVDEMMMKFNEATGVYQIFNKENQFITSAYVWTRYMMGFPIGISYIEFK